MEAKSWAEVETMGLRSCSVETLVCRRVIVFLSCVALLDLYKFHVDLSMHRQTFFAFSAKKTKLVMFATRPVCVVVNMKS